MSVRARLALQFVLVTGVILGVFSATLYQWVKRSLDAELDEQVEREFSAFRAHVLDEYNDQLRGLEQNIVTEIERYLETRKILGDVRRQRGDSLELLHSSTGFGPQVRGARVRALVWGVHYRGRAEMVRMPDGEDWRLICAVSEDSFRRHTTQLKLYFAIFIPVVLGIAWAVGLAFVRRALTPVEAMRRRAEHISRENLSERLPEPRQPGEFLSLARTFNEMLDRLDRAFRDLENFAADAAHELRTPLATLRAEIETALQQERSAEEHETILASLLEEVARMNRIVSNLFMLARIEMKDYHVRRDAVPLAPLLEDVREVWAPMAAERGITITLAIDGPPPTALGDPDALRRVLMNLVENAVKYNREGGSIEIAAAQANGRVQLCVRDTGIGIEARHLPSLFKRFFRADAARSRDRGGAGLGLAICKSVVEAHAGTIRVESTPGVGSRFLIDLPPAPAP